MSDEIRIKLNAKQTKVLIKRLRKIGAVDWLNKPLVDFQHHMLTSIMDNFKQQGRPQKWRKWKVKYRAWRKAFADTNKILVLSGTYKPLIRGKGGKGRAKKRVFNNQLRNSISKLAVGRSSFNISAGGVSAKYAAAHHFGFPTKKIPARPFMLFQDEDIEIGKEMFRITMQREVDKIRA